MAEHKHGEMDITVQEKTFNGFIRMVSRTAIVIVVALILLSLING
ncbi:aa3-type cytochrome c oxidase subunit IV [Roseisalinus antarcticus]|uniref:Cytochrome c oxidase subunit 4 n=1 Tax=Roseisalinus antarcticus TaxID=254357 RepID=A0A1Y5RNA8_9RHOB|nr:aa3-type cytochrome c oxidase subunit IV [Roseisalinus antarcticus]SLN21567.1 Cytochrome c oxidase subunit 4 [Roseisalinus antarcticus]